MRLPTLPAAVFALAALARAAQAEPAPDPDGGVPTPPYQTVVKGQPRREEIALKRLSVDEVTHIPGTQGDAVRAVGNLPGVARAPFDDGAISVRGSSPESTEIDVQGFRVPILFHFDGLTSILNSDLLSHVDFLAGNFSARYGRVTGGVIDVATRTPRQHWTGYIDINTLDAKALVEGPVLGGTLALAARRSYIDAYINAVLPDDAGFTFSTAPVYYDYQALYHRSLAGGDLSALLFGSDDRMALLFKRPDEMDPEVRGSARTTTSFHRLHVLWNRRLGTDQLRLGAALGFSHQDSTLGPDFALDLDQGTAATRIEYEHRISRTARLTVGADAELTPFAGSLRSPRPLDEGAFMTPLGAQPLLETHRRGVDITPAIYAEAAVRLGRLSLFPSTRLDYFRQTDRYTISPRLNARYQLSAATTLKGGVGLFTQPPDILESDPAFGNPALRPSRALHVSLGVEHDLGRGWSLDASAFYKRLDDLPVRSDLPVARDGRIAVEGYANQGVGRVYGGELMLRHQLRGGVFAWLSYTLMRSERRDQPGQGYRPFDFDQTHILTVVASKRWGRGWQLGARFRYVTGNPTTLPRGAVYDADADVYVPLPGSPNAARMAAFHQLDVRLDKQWRYRKWKLDRYIDVQNVYVHGNPEGYQYSYDFAKKRAVTSVPILISVGVRAEF